MPAMRNRLSAERRAAPTKPSAAPADPTTTASGKERSSSRNTSRRSPPAQVLARIRPKQSRPNVAPIDMATVERGKSSSRLSRNSRGRKIRFAATAAWAQRAMSFSAVNRQTPRCSRSARNTTAQTRTNTAVATTPAAA